MPVVKGKYIGLVCGPPHSLEKCFNKTSFINVKSSVRALAQRKTYTIGRDAYVESYINEVKPFHTKLREYKLGYTATDRQDGINTDFDNPPFYDSDDGKIRSIIATRDTTKLTEYPWKMWNDYHKKHVTSITVTSGGADYSTAPTVSGDLQALLQSHSNPPPVDWFQPFPATRVLL